jgi:hypothetical protein
VAYEVTIGTVYELALWEWGLTPEWINANWTEELLALMFTKRKERIERMRAKVPGEGQPPGRMDNKRFMDKHNLRVKRLPNA